MVDCLNIREANVGDSLDIWKWWNDPVTRRMMKKNDYVPWSEHRTWFDNLLADDRRILCLGQVASKKIGVVRFDSRNDDIYEVSINLNPSYRGFGYAPRMLTAASQYLYSRIHPKKLYATLKRLNIPSKKSFARAGFVYRDPPPAFPTSDSFSSETEFYCELIPEI